MLRRLHDDERGIAMIMALLISLVVGSLAVTVVAISAHNNTASALDRKRVQAVHAAEAGLDHYFSSLQTGSGAATCSQIQGTLPISPGADYTVRVELYSTWPPSGSPLSCPPPAGSTIAGAIVTSTGTAVRTGSNVAASRTMQAAVRMTPIYRGHGQAVFSDSRLDFQNQLTINGDAANDADVYTNGNYTMQNNTVISGSVYAQGTVFVRQGNVRQDIWANGSAELRTLTLSGNATSSTSWVSLHETTVHGNARAGTTITVGNNSSVRGTQTANSPTGPPPQIPLPQVTYDEQAWRNAGYSIETYTDCTQARNAIQNGGPAGQSRVIRVAAVCQVLFTNDVQIPVRGNTAIIADGSITTQTGVGFNATASGYTMSLVVPWRSGLPCTPTPSPYDISVSNRTRFNGLKMFVYSPCTVSFGNDNAGGVEGQIIGGTVNITNAMTLNFRPTVIPGVNLTGYNVETSYVREVKNPA